MTAATIDEDFPLPLNERDLPHGKTFVCELCMSDAVPQLGVLVVDDSPVSRKLLEHALSSEPYTLLFAKSGEEALRLFSKHKPELVITDWMLPDLSGPELCERIRTDAHSSYTYIILVTSITEKDSVVEGLSAGADDYITKPFDSNELRARMGVGRRIIGLHQDIDAKNRLLMQMAHTDPLTGLPNRRAIEAWAERQLRGAARHGFALWAVHADLDCFKKINDSYGHEAGDLVLKKFAEIMKKNTRASDISGRMGGDEFLLVMTHVDGKNIQLAVDRFRQRFASEKFIFGSETVSVTASFGISGFQGKEPPDFSMLVRQADQALYCAKRAGRNQAKIQSL
jgi:two-component system, cell cycle response regulator